MFNQPALIMINPWKRASVSFDNGELVAVKHYLTGVIRVMYINQWGEVSYPMLTKDNQMAWEQVKKAVAIL